MSKRSRQAQFYTHRMNIQTDEEIEIRDETFLGQDYIVVPVVAMVEGVRFGAAQSEPELGLASEFGANPLLWNNRPLVYNHPKVNGKFVSANQDVSVLEAYSFGFTMNASLDGDKLKMEAWINKSRVEELGEDLSDLVDDIVEGNMAEVSTGFFSQVDDSKGKFNGQTYKGTWRNIQPDHLAILSAGVLGACSNEAGCGIPRINQEDKGMSKPNELTTSKSEGEDCGCGCNGSGECKGDHGHEHEHETVTQSSQTKPSKRKTSVPTVASTAPIEVQDAEDRKDFREQMARQVVQELGDNILSNDVEKILRKALARAHGNYVYIYGFNNSVVVYEKYNYDCSNYYANGYTCYRQSFNVSDEGKVEFVGEPEEVILLTKIVPQEGQDPAGKVLTQENDMTKPNEQTADPAPVVQTEAPKPVEVPKVLTAQEYINQAPPELRDVLQSSMRMHSEKKASLVKTLSENSRNKFTKEQLEAKSVEELENLVELSGATPSYAGVAPAQAPVAQQESNTVPAPRVFEYGKKDAAAA